MINSGGLLSRLNHEEDRPGALSLPTNRTISRVVETCEVHSMPAPRLLVLEGNPPQARAEHVSYGGTVSSEGYATLLQEFSPSAVVDVCFPADAGVNLPDGQALEGYDGVAITGSSLHVYEGGPAVTQQVELARGGAQGQHAGVRKLLGTAGAHCRRRRRGAQESERPRGRLRPQHQSHRGRPQASDVQRQARHLQRADRASRRGRDAGARHDGACHQCGVRRAERRDPLQRRDRVGRAISSRVSAARGRDHRAAASASG